MVTYEDMEDLASELKIERYYETSALLTHKDTINQLFNDLVLDLTREF